MKVQSVSIRCLFLFLIVLPCAVSIAQPLLWKKQLPYDAVYFDATPNGEYCAIGFDSSIIVFDGNTGAVYATAKAPVKVFGLTLYSGNRGLYFASVSGDYYSWNFRDTVEKIYNGNYLIRNMACFSSYRGRFLEGISRNRKSSFSSGITYTTSQTSVKCFAWGFFYNGLTKENKTLDYEPYFMSDDGRCAFGYVYSQEQYFNQGGGLTTPVSYTFMQTPYYRCGVPDSFSPIAMYDSVRYVQTHSGIYDVKLQRHVKSLPSGGLVNQRYILTMKNSKPVLHDIVTAAELPVLDSILRSVTVKQCFLSYESQALFIIYADTIAKYNLASLVAALPPMKYTASPVLPDTVTAGDTISFDARAFPETGSRYTWDFGDGSDVITTDTGRYMYRRAGTYTITMNAVSEPMNQHARVEKSIVVLPMAALQISIVTDRQTVQPNVPVSFTASVTPKRYTQYEWDFGDGLQSTVIAPSHTYSKPGSYTVTLRVLRTLDGTQAQQSITVLVTGGIRLKVWSDVIDNGPIRSLSFSPDGAKLLITPQATRIQERNALTGNQLSTLRIEGDSVITNLFSYYKPDSDSVYYCGYILTDKTQINVFLLASTLLPGSQPAQVSRTLYCPSAYYPFDNSRDKYVSWRLRSSNIHRITATYDNTSPDGVTGFSTHATSRYDCEESGPQPSTFTVNNSCFGGRVHTIGSTALNWNISCGISMGMSRIPDAIRSNVPFGIIYAVRTLSNNRYAWSISGTNSIAPKYIVITDKKCKELKRFEDSTYAIAVTANGNRLITRTGVWDIEQGTRVQNLYLPSSSWYEVFPDGVHIAIRTEQTVKVMNLHTGERLYESDSLYVPIAASALSKNGRYLAIGATNGSVIVLNMDSILGIEEDSLHQTTPPESNAVIYPNPTSGGVTLAFRNPYSGDVLVHDILGNEVYRTSVHSQQSVFINVPECSIGAYSISAGVFRGFFLKQ
ncbi:MAG: PKD domain-containing protein [Candidatus Kapabacteria bacterium]|nr:PKD domain-containing protein [Candidatus Kapabacteria bacterium]